MRIHTDTLDRSEIESFVPAGLSIGISEHRSQSHRRAFEISMAAPEGSDRWGNPRKQSPYHGGTDEFPRAATWVEWGDFIVEVFKNDPFSKMPRIYDDAHDFVRKTHAAAAFRKEATAEEAADRWSTDLYYARQGMSKIEASGYRQGATS